VLTGCAAFFFCICFLGLHCFYICSVFAVSVGILATILKETERAERKGMTCTKGLVLDLNTSCRGKDSRCISIPKCRYFIGSVLQFPYVRYLLLLKYVSDVSDREEMRVCCPW